MNDNYLRLMNYLKKPFLRERSSRFNDYRIFLISTLFLVPLLLNSFFSNDKAYLVESDSETCGVYCKTTLFFPEYFTNKSFDQYFIQKSLHSFFANIIMITFRINPSPLNANSLLEIQSYVLLILMIPILISIKKILNLGILEYWVLYTFIILNAINIKYLSYSQESPDTVAIFFCLLAILVYLKNKFYLFLIITLLSSFIQPQFKIICYIFLVFFHAPKMKISFKTKVNEIIIKTILFIIFFIAIIFIFMGVLREKAAVIYLSPYTITIFLPISIIVASIYLSFILNYFIKFKILSNLIKMASIKKVRLNLFLVIVIELVNFLIRITYAKGEPESNTSSVARQGYTLLSFFYMSVQQPLKFFIPHVVMFGPIFVVVFILLLKNLRSSDIYFVDTAIVLVSFFFMLFCIDPESRHLAVFLPILIILLIVFFDFPRVALLYFVVCNIVFSRFYSTMYTIELNSDIYFLKLGPWYTTSEYIKSFFLFFSITIISFVTLSKYKPKPVTLLRFDKK